jgi:hypothetical protein
MRLLGPSSEDEMVAVFLAGEVDSPRYTDAVRALIASAGTDESLVRDPDLADPTANARRRAILEGYRAYERREGLFHGFPRDVAWHSAVLDAEEVLDILYINWDWWLELSGGTRRPRDAARRILAGEVADVDLAEDEALAAAAPFAPPLIAVTTPAHMPVVLVEGHSRLTAYATFPQYLPTHLELVLGVSAQMAGWSEF